MSNLCDEAIRVAQRAIPRKADGSYGADDWTARAYHHASDLLHYAAGERTTTRCMLDYEPDDQEAAVEAILAQRGIRRGMHSRRT
jgi:hypothetical protein